MFQAAAPRCGDWPGRALTAGIGAEEARRPPQHSFAAPLIAASASVVDASQPQPGAGNRR